MALTVIVRSGGSDRPGLSFDAPRVVIGRGEGCEVRLPDPSVSHRHASIRQRGAEYIVQDEGSTNGTFVGPVRLAPGAPRLLRSGDRIRLGRVWLEIRIEAVPVTQNPAVATKDLALALVAQALAAQGEPSRVRVQVVEGSNRGKSLEMTEPDHAYVIGRGKNVDLSLDDTDLSRRHVQITRKADRLFVKDLGAKNGSTLDGETIIAERDVPWPLGKRLRIGSHELEYEDPLRAALAELEQVADERLNANELVDDADSPEAPRPEGAAAEGPRSAPKPVEAPRRRAGAAARQGAASPGWTATDYLVALVALVVLGMSILAITWLVRSG